MTAERSEPLLLSYLALLRTGLAVPVRSPGTAVGSYPTVSPLPTEAGGLFSVALSVGFPLLGVTQRPALRSPDFPRAATTGPRSPPPPLGIILFHQQNRTQNANINVWFNTKKKLDGGKKIGGVNPWQR